MLSTIQTKQLLYIYNEIKGTLFIQKGIEKMAKQVNSVRIGFFRFTYFY